MFPGLTMWITIYFFAWPSVIKWNCHRGWPIIYSIVVCARVKVVAVDHEQFFLTNILYYYTVHLADEKYGSGDINMHPQSLLIRLHCLHQRSPLPFTSPPVYVNYYRYHTALCPEALATEYRVCPCMVCFSIVSMLRHMERMLTNYAVPIAFINGDKWASFCCVKFFMCV